MMVSGPTGRDFTYTTHPLSMPRLGFAPDRSQSFIEGVRVTEVVLRFVVGEADRGDDF